MVATCALLQPLGHTPREEVRLTQLPKSARFNLYPLTADLEQVRGIAIGVVYLGLPGLLVGLALGVVIQRWTTLLLLSVATGVTVNYAVQRVSAGSSGDNDPAVVVEVALITNLIAFIVGVVLGRFAARRRTPLA